MGRSFGVVGMVGAGLFFVGLLIEYAYGLFPPGSGLLFVSNQIQFVVAMSCVLVMLWGMGRMRAGGDGRFGRVVLSLFAIGWAALILGGIAVLVTGNADNLFFPLGGMMTMIFGLLAGIAIVFGKKWQGWPRFALLFQALYYLLVMMLPLFLIDSSGPTLLTESLWMATWLLVGWAVIQQAKSDATQLAGD